MARTKQRENYGNGSVSPVMVQKVDATGAPVTRDGKPVRVQQTDREGKQVWRVAITLGVEKYVDQSGNVRKRQRKVQRLVHGTLTEARNVCKRLVEDYEAVDVAKARERFSALCAEWKRNAGANCSPKQMAQYERFLKRMAVYLDEKPLIELRKDDVRTALEAASRKADGTTLSAVTVGKILAVTRRVFTYAVDEEYLVRNPCRGIQVNLDAPDPKRRRRRALSEEEASLLCSRLDKDEAAAYEAIASKEQRQAEWGNTFNRSSIRGLSTMSCYIAVRLMLATGMRRGESLALTWRDVDLDNGTVRIANTLTETMDIKEPKTDNGIRTIFVDVHTAQHLRRWKAFQKTMLHLVMRKELDGKGGERLVPVDQSLDTPVCCSDAGGWLDPTNCYRWWSSYRESAGFPGILLHEMRHTQITLLRNNGVDPYLIKLRVGHARDNSAMWTYTHEAVESSRVPSETMGAILYESGRGKVLTLDRESA